MEMVLQVPMRPEASLNVPWLRFIIVLCSRLLSRPRKAVRTSVRRLLLVHVFVQVFQFYWT